MRASPVASDAVALQWLRKSPLGHRPEIGAPPNSPRYRRLRGFLSGEKKKVFDLIHIKTERSPAA
jgi:hypothetical protein